jgi:hypothetical protein
MKANRLSMYSRGVAVVLGIPLSVAKRIVLWYQERHAALPPLDQELSAEEVIALLSVTADDVNLPR